MTEASSHTLASVTVPMTGSLLLTGGVAFLLCKPPARPSLSWIELAALALIYVAAAVCAHAAVLSVLCRVFNDHIGASRAVLISGSWLSAAWMPLLALLVRRNSAWMAAVPPLITGPIVLFFRRWQAARDDPAGAGENASVAATLFLIQEPPSFVHTVIPAAATAVALEAGVLTLLLGYEFTTGWLFAACTVFPIWKLGGRELHPPGLSNGNLSSGDRPSGWKAGATRAAGRELAVVILCMGIALLPYLKLSGAGSGLLALLHAKRAIAASSGPTPPVIPPRSSRFYSGVVLFLPPKPKVLVAPPAPDSGARANGLRLKPIVIPFDGVYWYFQVPDDRPEPDAPVVRGDPAKASVRSTNSYPISMEAHQYLGSPVRMDCCRTLRVELVNADNRPGIIVLEVVLKHGAGKASTAQSLGNLVVPSSVARETASGRSPVHETLTFPLPANARNLLFDEIAVVMKPARERELLGTRIAIQQFELVP